MVGISAIGQAWKCTKNLTHNYANFVIGVEQNTAFSEALQKLVRGTKNLETKKFEGGKGFKNFGGNLKSAWVESKKAVEGKSVWKVIKESFSNIGPEFKALEKGSKLGGVGKILGKRIPLISNLLMVCFAVPGIIKAFTDKKDGGGLFAGLGEIGKTAANIGGFAAGAAIGSVFGPVGMILGGFAGSWIADKIVGKSFAAKKEEKAEIIKKAQEQGQIQNTSLPAVQAAGTDVSGQQPATSLTPSFSGKYSNPFSSENADKDLMSGILGINQY
jgi:hypothetical protein